MRKVFALALVLNGSLACSLVSPIGISKSKGRLIQPDEAHVDLSNLALKNFSTPENQAILQCYFAGNERWEVLQECGITYAVRLEKINEKYQTSLNGYYSQYDEN